MPSFQELMAQATRNSAQAQEAAVERERERKRLEAEKERQRLDKERREREFIAQRKREREEEEARRKAEEAKRETERALAMTRNLHALNDERKKRGLEPVPARSAKPAKSKEEIEAETRADRERKRRLKMFATDKRGEPSAAGGSMALAKAALSSKSHSATSLPKVKPFDGAVRTSTLPLKVQRAISPASSSNSISRSASRHIKPATLNKGKGKKSNVPAFDPTQFKALNTNPRDIRTIEEIERDLKAKKRAAAGLPPLAPASPSETVARSVSKTPMQALPSPARTQSPSKPKLKRQRPSSSSPRSSSYSSDEIDSHERGLPANMRDEIWKIMGGGRARRVYNDDDDSSDDDSAMEATGADLEAEERRAEKIAMREDREEQAKLERHAQEKRRRLLGSTGKKNS